MEIQRKLKEYNEEHPEEEDIIVRIGMHMGQVSVEDHVQPDIFGRHVNRGSRVVDLADGGHIYLSQPVYENALGWLKDQDLVWQDHGEYKVAGVDEPIRIYEVADYNVISPKAPSQKRYVSLRDRLKIPVAVAATCLIVFLATFFVLKQRMNVQQMPPQKHSIAITYFENIIPNPEHDWLQKGLTAMLITDLAKLKQFNVVDRGRLQEMLEQMKFGKTGIVSKETAQKVGKALGVDSILTGSYIITKPTIRIDARLVSVKTNSVITADEIQGELNKLYQLGQQLAMKIASGLNIVPTAEEENALSKPLTKSLDATEFYSRGLDYLDREMYDEAIKAFRKATKADSSFFMPCSAIIIVYICKVVSEEKVSEKEYEEAATEWRAIEIETIEYADIGMLEGAISRFERAVKSDDKDLKTHLALGALYNLKGNVLSPVCIDKSIKEFKIALELNPSKPAAAIIHFGLALDYGWRKGAWEEAISELQRAIALAPTWGILHEKLGDLYKDYGQYDEAIAEYEELIRLEPDYPEGYRKLGDALQKRFTGPINAVVADKKYVIIIPTHESDKAVQDKIHTYAKGIHDRFFKNAPILTDEEALNQDLSTNALFVYGTIMGNLWLAQYLAELPVHIKSDRIVADTVYLGTHLRFITAWPNPQNPQKGVVIYTAQQAEDIIDINRVFHGPTDYVVAKGIEVLRAANYKKQNGRWTFE